MTANLKSREDSPRRSDAIVFAEEASRACGYHFELIDTHSGYLCRVSHNGQFVFIGDGNVSSWPINGATAASLATDKAFSSLVLSKAGIRTPDGHAVFLSERYRNVREGGRELSDLPALVASFGWPLIAKPNNGSRGAYVRLCADSNELQEHLHEMGTRYDIALIQRFIRGSEYRVFVYDGRAEFSYRKKASQIVSDGIRTVRELLESRNQKLVGDGLDPVSTRAIQNRVARALSLDTVLPKGRLIDSGIRANLSAGGSPEDFATTVIPLLADVAVRAANTLGLVVAGVDVMVPDIETEPPIVLEVNSNPSISSLRAVDRTELAIGLYKRVLHRLLEQQ